MTRVRHMALWLAAVIVLIAVGLVPSGAQAHAGHPPAAGLAAPAPAASADAQVLLSDAKIRTVVVLTVSPAKALSSGACDGACCNGGCRGPNSCCAGAGLAPDGADAVVPRGSGDRAQARALPARTDVVPEALPEPPRSVA